MKKWVLYLLMIASSICFADSLDNKYAKGMSLYKKNEFEKAFRIFKEMADAGDSQGLYNLGIMYESGKGVERNEEKALQSFQKCADNWFDNCLFEMGNVYMYGSFNVQKNSGKAYDYYMKVALKGHTEAEYKVGSMNFRGDGVGRNDETAFKFMKKAADKGHILGQRSIGIMYESGWGVKKNETEAINYYKKSAKQGDQASVQQLKKLGIDFK